MVNLDIIQNLFELIVKIETIQKSLKLKGWNININSRKNLDYIVQ